ncbi:hypothetical protein LJR235_001968 [Pararhizobium sp. LjRoot235]|uniref:hypothetical protein n=1 Tax=Pararhizobium sp. LjRoot235 TaxID=3342291 RepID=UPI003ECCA219
MPPSFTERRRTALPQRTIEMFGLPGDRCADPACRRRGRCQGSAPQGPACLNHLTPGEQTFYKRLLDHCHWAERSHLHFLQHYIRAIDDPFLMLVGEIVRRVQPRGHWLHAALPRWYKETTGRRGHAPISLTAAAQAPVRWY